MRPTWLGCGLTIVGMLNVDGCVLESIPGEEEI